MGILKDNDDNLEDQNLTFFFDGSKKLNEFVLNKNKSHPVSSDNRHINGVTSKNPVSEKELIKQVQDDKSNVNSSCHTEPIDGAVENNFNSSDSNSSSNSSIAP